MPDNEERLCANCDKSFAIGDLQSVTIDGSRQWICSGCSDSMDPCERCGDYVDTDSLSTVNVRAGTYTRRTEEQGWCSSCVEEHACICDSCGERYSEGASWYRATRDRRICSHCSDSGDFCSCSSCGIVMDSDECNLDEDGDGHYCEDCFTPRMARCVRDYGYKPKPIFYGGANKIHYGVELEVDCDQDYASDVINILGTDHVYLKEDGSIDSGFEIVTHPHTLEAHRELWKDRFWKLAQRRMDADNNGMHVHIQRKYLDAYRTGMMQAFLNCEANRAFVHFIANRNSEGYAKLKTYLGKVSAHGSGDRYQALNLTNGGTVEVRIFRGTVNRQRFFANLEFCDALVHFTIDRSYQDLGYRSFCQYVLKRRKDYANLYKRLTGCGYLPAPKPKPANLPVKTTKENVTCAL